MLQSWERWLSPSWVEQAVSIQKVKKRRRNASGKRNWEDKGMREAHRRACGGGDVSSLIPPQSVSISIILSLGGVIVFTLVALFRKVQAEVLVIWLWLQTWNVKEEKKKTHTQTHTSVFIFSKNLMGFKVSWVHPWFLITCKPVQSIPLLCKTPQCCPAPLLPSHVFNINLYSAEDQRLGEDPHILGTGLMVQVLDWVGLSIKVNTWPQNAVGFKAI